ncbi:MAG: DNA polymerase IV, partial [Treponema sp.]|nr:DNA polymerase IV [Treponema sp.]
MSTDRSDASFTKVYFHVDLDAFFASVEQREHPEYRGKPLVVGGLKTDRRSVVSTASYEARKYGIHSAMPVSKAALLCPDAIFIRGNYALYEEVSQTVMQIFSNYSPFVIQMSIDEAFIDMTGSEKLFGPPQKAAQKLKDEVFKKTGLTVSVGVSSSMYVAKIASGLSKPDGLTVVNDGDEEKFMLSLPLEKLWGCGEKTQAHLKQAGLFSIPLIHSKSKELLVSIFGQSTGTFIYNAVRGNKDMQFGTEAKNHSISSERTFDFDLTDRYAIETAVMEIAQHVLFRMHREKVRSRTIAIKIRYGDFTTVSVQETYDMSITSAHDFFEKAKVLLNRKLDSSKGVRLLGVSFENVTSLCEPEQQPLFDFGEKKRSKIEKAIFDLEEKNPAIKITKARLL